MEIMNIDIFLVLSEKNDSVLEIQIKCFVYCLKHIEFSGLCKTVIESEII